MRGFLQASEACEHVCCPSLDAFYSWLYRRRKAGFPVTTYRRGSKLLFKPEDLDAALSVERDRRSLRKVG